MWPPPGDRKEGHCNGHPFPRQPRASAGCRDWPGEGLEGGPPRRSSPPVVRGAGPGGPLRAYVDPRLVIELRDVLGEILEVAEGPPGCRYGCGATPFHGPATDPLEKVMAQLHGAGWFPCWNAVQDRAAHESVCLVRDGDDLAGALSQH